MYVARDENGELWLYEKKPEKILHSWAVKCGWFSALPSYALPEVKWEDEEPHELVLKKPYKLILKQIDNGKK